MEEGWADPGRFEIVARRRPVALVAPGFADVTSDGPGSWPLPQPAPYAGATASGCRELALTSGATRVVAVVAAGGIGLRVTADGRTTHHRSRRFGDLAGEPAAIGLTLTGTHATAFVREGRRWIARARYDLRERVDTSSEDFSATLEVSTDGRGLVAGGFGQLGLRDVRLVTEADGTPVRDDGRLLLTATHAGPGFFDAAHTGVWSLDPEGWRLEHRGDLYFRRSDKPGVYGDHATHLLRTSTGDGGRWLVATSTWGDFSARSRTRPGTSVGVTLAESNADLTRGRHVVDTTYLPLPTDGPRSVGVWDPHLVRYDGGWLAGYVSATRFFRFHPVLAGGPSLADLELRGADPTRTATEGTTVVRLGTGAPVVMASDGRRGPRALRAAFPVYDLALRELGRLDAPYPTNIPWPSLADLGDRWAMVTFDGTPAGGELVGYGSHGDLVVATTRAEPYN